MTIGSIHTYVAPALTCPNRNAATSSNTAPPPRGRACDLPSGEGWSAIRHGRHRNAIAAPSSRPLERVNVQRYRKLVVSTGCISIANGLKNCVGQPTK